MSGGWVENARQGAVEYGLDGVMNASRSIVMLRSNDILADSRVQKESKSLAEHGYRVRVVGWDRAFTHPPQERFINATKAKVTLVGIKASYSGGFKRNFLPLLRFQLAIANQLVRRRHEYGYIHACDFDTAFIACIVNAFLKKKFVYDIFDYYIDAFNVPSRIKPLIARLDRWVMKRADSIIVCNEKRREQICFSDQKKVFVIHNSPQSIDKSVGQTDGVSLCHNIDIVDIVYVGVFAPGRLIEELLELAEERCDVRLHIAGFGALENEVRAAAERCGHVRFYGKLSYEDALQLESKATIMIALYDPDCPNHKYAAPNKFYEALMLGKPLITTKGIGIDEIIESQSFGVATHYSKEGLSKGIDAVLEMLRKREVDRSKMKRTFEVKYSWNRMADRLLLIYAALES
ncbi:hypothetical protein B5F44_13525 [Gordonibacter urolithinfaciens]|nr:hypothetical protein B5F44_13525 [Gordonibacter urolithinfaciens]